MKSTTLYFKGGTSDKVYRAAIERRDGGHVVTFAYGRRGSAMTTGTKTPEPVTLAEATEIFSKLEQEKRGKGYTNGPDSEPYSGINGAMPTGILPQLLNPVTDMEADVLIRDDRYLLQPKMEHRSGESIVVGWKYPSRNGSFGVQVHCRATGQSMVNWLATGFTRSTCSNTTARSGDGPIGSDWLPCSTSS